PVEVAQEALPQPSSFTRKEFKSYLMSCLDFYNYQRMLEEPEILEDILKLLEAGQFKYADIALEHFKKDGAGSIAIGFLGNEICEYIDGKKTVSDVLAAFKKLQTTFKIPPLTTEEEVKETNYLTNFLIKLKPVVEFTGAVLQSTYDVVTAAPRLLVPAVGSSLLA
ncbi:hypothetical protein AXA84_0473, partial [Candidatus Phytoplasma oryzae]